MKMKNLILFSCFVITISSCKVFRSSTSKSMDIYGSGVIQKPTIVDLKVDENKIAGTASSSISTTEVLKQEAIVDALKKCKCDIIVEPSFEIISAKGNTTVIVNGFPAFYKNFRPITKEDVELINVGVTQKAKVYEPSSTSGKKKSGGAAIGITLGLLAVMLGLGSILLL
jgi:hypothetical protein